MNTLKANLASEKKRIDDQINIVGKKVDTPYFNTEMKGAWPCDPLAAGPGPTAQALDIDLAYNGAWLQGPDIWLEECDTAPPPTHTDRCHLRVGGVDYAGDDALLPWRFRLQ